MLTSFTNLNPIILGAQMKCLNGVYSIPRVEAIKQTSLGRMATGSLQFIQPVPSLLGSEWDTSGKQSTYYADKRTTSKARYAGDHDCSHSKVDGTILPLNSPWSPIPEGEYIYDCPKFGTKYVVDPTVTGDWLPWSHLSQVEVHGSLFYPFTAGKDVLGKITFSNMTPGRYPLGAIGSKAKVLLPQRFLDVSYVLRSKVIVPPTSWTGVKCYSVTLSSLSHWDYYQYASNTLTNVWSVTDGHYLFINVNGVYGVYGEKVLEDWVYYCDPKVNSNGGITSEYREDVTAGGTIVKTGDPAIKLLVEDWQNHQYDSSKQDATWIALRDFRGTTRKPTAVSSTVVTFQPPSLGLSQPKFMEAAEILRCQSIRRWDNLPLADSSCLGEAAAQAAEGARCLDINSLAYFKDLPEIVKSLKEVITLLSKVASPQMLLADVLRPKFWAGLHLSNEYGIRLTLKDTKEAIAAFQRKYAEVKQTIGNSYSSTNSRTFYSVTDLRDNLPVDRIVTYKLYYQQCDSKIMRLLKTLQDWDLWLTGGNAWDLIPFSFVIDWFINIGDMIESADTRNYFAYLNIQSCVWAVKDKFSDPYIIPDITNQFSVCGLVHSRYHREVQAQPHLPLIDLGHSSGVKNHELEAGAIIIQLLPGV